MWRTNSQPLALPAIFWKVSTGEQVGEKHNSFQSLNKIEIFKDNYQVLFGKFPPMKQDW
jgi:hypothetical protein